MMDHSLLSGTLQRIRNLMQQNDLDALIINRCDEHLSEYLAPNAERLAYITGFTGSFGIAVILKEADLVTKLNTNLTIDQDSGSSITLKNSAAIFVDGRYTLQVRNQTDINQFDTFHFFKVKVEDWITAVLGNNANVGIDPKCVSHEWFSKIKNLLQQANIKLVFTPFNFVDHIWTEKQKEEISPALIFDDKYNGCPSIEKRKLIANLLREKQIDATILSKSESVNWLLNIRGRDVPNLPVVNSFAVVYSSEHIEWYVNPAKVPATELAAFQHHFGNVDYYSEENLEDLTKRLGKNKCSIYVDPHSTNAWLIDSLIQSGASLTFGQDLCDLPKACKNPIEIQGMKRCHLRDAVAMCRFLAWLDHITEPFFTEAETENHSANYELAKSYNEASISDQLFKFRQEQDFFIETSFDTISSLGPNASIIHYNHKNLGTPRPLGLDPMYLVDSGGQYMDGTTDITRTILVGPGLTNEMKERFTLVLKGVIAMHRIRFPKNTFGISLDVLARAPLWQVGLNFDHGTGHGVGHCLNVHEGPQSISQRSGQIALREGMVTSIEPGFYKDNEYGIRCENLSVIETVRNSSNQSEMLAFVPITFVPFDIRLIKKELLTENEKMWINDYHFKVREIVKEHLSDFEIGWLLKATATI